MGQDLRGRRRSVLPIAMVRGAASQNEPGEQYGNGRKAQHPLWGIRMTSTAMMVQRKADGRYRTITFGRTRTQPSQHGQCACHQQKEQEERKQFLREPLSCCTVRQVAAAVIEMTTNNAQAAPNMSEGSIGGRNKRAATFGIFMTFDEAPKHKNHGPDRILQA